MITTKIIFKNMVTNSTRDPLKYEYLGSRFFNTRANKKCVT